MESNLKGRVKKACEICRRRKIKCDGYLPCSSCGSLKKKCHYQDSIGIKKPPLNSKKSQMYRELDTILHAFSKLKSSDTLNTEMMSSGLLQMEGMLNGYRKQLDLLPDLQIDSTDGNISYEKILFKPEKLKFGKIGNREVGPYFGLYNPACLESIDSFGWILKKFDLRREDSKYVIFFFLKYLDLATKSYGKLLMLSSSPSEWLSSRLKISGTPSEQIPLAIEVLTREVPFDVDFSSGLFELVCNFITKMRQFNSSNPHEMNNLKERLIQEETILLTGYLSFIPSIFSEMHDIGIVSSILLFLEAMHWQMSLQTIGRFVSESVRRCLDLGLSRWEYYCNLNEDKAESYRKIWWKCFWWDRWYSLISGKPFLIDDDCVLCLFPRCVTNLGARDAMSTKELLDLFQPDKENIFFYIILSKLITEVLGGIAYNRKYTGSLQDSEVFLQDLSNNCKTTLNLFDVLGQKFNFFTNTTADYNNLSLSLAFNYTQVACVSAIESVLLRFKKVPESPIVEKNYTLCQQILLYVIQIEAPNLIYIFIGAISNFLVIFMFNLLEKGTGVYDLTILCRVAKLLEEFDEGTDESYFYVSYFKVISFRVFIIVRICIDHHMCNSNISKLGLINAISEFDPESSKMCMKLLDKNSQLFDPLVSNADMSNFHLTLLKLFKGEIGPNFSEEVRKILEEDSRFPLDHFDLFQSIQEMPMSGFDELDAFLNHDLSLDNLKDI
ncbi:hypothetical protein ZYGM_000182 [Zygosaccharomyces mellis]|uniref:Zn(2)-C6 fungal-type domain-containing protein n=1 Tax=Zygosaccharomyces mellis TaxID=42258 RepID=A0A4C2EID5_9SACH|nr:hypothetical protein ZYGM_000182 [Zygosaccharomyces mellis]